MRRRLWLAAATAAVLLAGVAGLAFGPGRAALLEAGKEALEPRERLVLEASRERSAAPLAVFLGDSTFRRPHSHPTILQRRLGAKADLRLLWAPGLGPPEHYLLLGRALEQEPEAVVVLVNLRLLWGDGPLWYPDLLTLLPAGELPRALRLPFHAREVGAARLLLASLLGTLRSELPLYAFAGGHSWARSAPLLRWLAPLRFRARAPERLEEEREERIGRYGERLYPGHPALAMLEAALELAARRGARVLALVSPVPVMRLLEGGVYLDAGVEQRIAQVRQVADRTGADWLDLHDALAPEGFSDDLGHFSASGARRVAARVDPWLRSALGIPRSP